MCISMSDAHSQNAPLEVTPVLNRRATHQVELSGMGVETAPLRRATTINLPVGGSVALGDSRLSVTLMDVHGTVVGRETRRVYIGGAEGGDRPAGVAGVSCPSSRWHCPTAAGPCACSGHGTCMEGSGACTCQPDWYGIDCSHGVIVRDQNPPPSEQPPSRRAHVFSVVNQRVKPWPC